MRRAIAFWHVLIATATPPLLAHDFWIEPSTYRPAVVSTVRLALRAGDDIPGTPVRRDPAQIVRFAAVAAAGEGPVVGAPGADPAGFVRIEEPGVVVVAYRSGRYPIELAGDRFEEHLRREGLAQVTALRAARGETAAPGREVFSRCAKSLLLAGGGAGEGFDRRVGLTFELVPLNDPHALAPGGALEVLALYRDEPLAGALLDARSFAAPRTRVAARTDEAGRATLRLDRPGPWLVAAVHMVEAPPDAGADWESFWASLTFELPAGD